MLGIYKKVKYVQTKPVNEKEAVVSYGKKFVLQGEIEKAELYITAHGVYYAEINNIRVSMPLAPGFDCYLYRQPYQIYDVTKLLKCGEANGNGAENEIFVSVARGWYGWYARKDFAEKSAARGVKAALFIAYKDGRASTIETDETWRAFYGKCVSSDIYNGETYDETRKETPLPSIVAEDDESSGLFLYDGEEICEHERLTPARAFTTPSGEFVVDFGQEITGYAELNFACGSVKQGDVIELSHAEVLDKNGNFYTENYRSAKAKLTYVCGNGAQTYKPLHTFFGFRYIRFDKKPCGVSEKNITAVAVYSNLKRTGFLRSSSALLNRFFENVFWGQKDNFLDIPTDCPQRDERQGWTGDAQVFCRAATYNFDCEKFYARWLRMIKCEQEVCGYVPHIVPNVWYRGCSAVWGDAATIMPWEIYKMYGNKAFLAEFFPMMKRHADYIGEVTTTPYLWTGGTHFGDWLALDGKGMEGASRHDFIASAFYAYSVSLVIKAGEELKENVDDYRTLYPKIRAAFLQTYEPETQTECVLALQFDLTDDKKATAEQLARKIADCGNHLQTGFVGTPYLLYALSDNGYTDLAYGLLLREEFPSWLYSVKCGATTVWEHWDGKNENGDFWSAEMNSFNHYAYGAVIAWVYEIAAGITPLKPGFEKIRIAPEISGRLESLEVRLKTRRGEIFVKWQWKNGIAEYEIETPADTVIEIAGNKYELPRGGKFNLKI